MGGCRCCRRRPSSESRAGQSAHTRHRAAAALTALSRARGPRAAGLDPPAVQRRAAGLGRLAGWVNGCMADIVGEPSCYGTYLWDYWAKKGAPTCTTDPSYMQIGAANACPAPLYRQTGKTQPSSRSTPRATQCAPRGSQPGRQRIGAEYRCGLKSRKILALRQAWMASATSCGHCSGTRGSCRQPRSGTSWVTSSCKI